jgi:uncharacterized protein (DUF1330 family)
MQGRIVLPGYLIFDIEVTDAAAWAEYLRIAGPIMAAGGGKFVLRSEHCEPLEGGWSPSTISVVEFPSYEAARDFYYSDEYQVTVPLRQRASVSRGILVSVLPGREPSA